MEQLTQADWDVMSTAAAYASHQEFEKALAAFSSVERHTTDPRELTTILLNEAQCYRMLRDFEAAHAKCGRALDLSRKNDEDTVDAWVIKIAILVDEGRTADALDVVEGSLRRYPGVNRDIQLLKKGELLASLGRHAEAVPVLSGLLQSSGLEESEIATIHYTLGVSYAALGEFDNAAQHLGKAESLPLPAGYLSNNSFWLANIAARRQDYHAAKSYLLKALSQIEHSNAGLLTDIYESLANISRELGDAADAAKYASLWEASNQMPPNA
jgi:tetratricopeptide (TPR) repeat protein